VAIAVLTPASASAIYPLPHILNSLTHALLTTSLFMATTLSAVAFTVPTPSTGLVLDPSLAAMVDATTVTVTMNEAGDVAQIYTRAEGGVKTSVGEVGKTIKKVKGKLAGVLSGGVREVVLGRG